MIKEAMEKNNKDRDSLLSRIKSLPGFNTPVLLNPANIVAIIDQKQQGYYDDEDGMVLELKQCDDGLDEDYVNTEQEILFAKALKLLDISILSVEYQTFDDEIDGESTLYDMAYYKLNCSVEYYEAIVELGNEIPTAIKTGRE